MNNQQLSFSLVDEVAPLFPYESIRILCHLIDEKANKGLKYNDLKQQLLSHLASKVDLADTNQRNAYQFAKHY